MPGTMPWRNVLLYHLGPGLFAGITFRDWLALLRANHFAISPRYLPRAAVNTLYALGNSVLRMAEEWKFAKVVRESSIAPPLFVLGHWRSGTTHLHNLLTLDPRFAFPTLYEVYFPHIFLLTEAVVTRLTKFFLPRARLGVDNVRLDYALAYEDEFALCMATGLSPYTTWAFPLRADYYDRYLTLRDVSPMEVDQWRRALVEFFRKLSYKHGGRPLVLKSPPHTGRIRLLLELFPGARFVHIRRDPYAVFQSTCRMSEIGWRYYCLQPLPDARQREERVLRQYREMYEALFADRPLVPAGQFHEVAFEELERDPIGQLRHVYEALRLPDFAAVEPAVRHYLSSLAGYQKNRFPELSAEARQRVAKEWGRCFAEWGYPV